MVDVNVGVNDYAPAVVVASGAECPACGRIYRQRANMLNHQRYECGKPARFACPFCSKRMKLKGNLKKHMLKLHADLLTDKDILQL